MKNNQLQNSLLLNKLRKITENFLIQFPQFTPIFNRISFIIKTDGKMAQTKTDKNYVVNFNDEAYFWIEIPQKYLENFDPDKFQVSSVNLYTTLLHEILHIVLLHFDWPDSWDIKQIEKFYYCAEYCVDKLIVNGDFGALITPQGFYYDYLELFENVCPKYKQIDVQLLNPWEMAIKMTDSQLRKIKSVIKNDVICSIDNFITKNESSKNVGRGTQTKTIFWTLFYLKKFSALTKQIPLRDPKWGNVTKSIAEISGLELDWDYIDEEMSPYTLFTTKIPFWPGIKRRKLTEVLLVIDVSSSMSLEEIIRGYNAIVSSYEIRKIITHNEKIIYCGQSDEFLNLPLEAGGGTSYSDVFDWLSKNHTDEIIVHVTDGYCLEPSEVPHKLANFYLFVFTSNKPFGNWLKYKHIFLYEDNS
jgi:hypothetical protein